MVRHLEAVFENGVLRPLELLSLTEHQRVKVTIEDCRPVVADVVKDGQAEMAWLHAHRHEYAGQWVAIDGDRLLAHGPEAVPVRDEARRLGVRVPFVVRIPPDFGEPSAGWL